MMPIWDDARYLYLLGILPVMGVVYLVLLLWRRQAQARFADPASLRRLVPDASRSKSLLKLVFLALGLAFLIIALANPKEGEKWETVTRQEGVDIVFAVDVSKSMLAEDILPNRLKKSKRLVGETIDRLVGDRIGIIAYAGQAYPQLPITTDYGAGKLFLDGLNTDMLSSQGTAINAAIDLAATYYDDEQQTNRVLFIISDGEDHSGEITLGAVEAAVEAGIRIYTIGVGTEKGGPIPIRKRGVVDELKRDIEGEVVITRRNPMTLKAIAQRGKGIYIDGSNTETALQEIQDELVKLERRETESKDFASYKDRFQRFLGIGLVFLFLETFLLDRRTGWLKRLNLFNEDNGTED